MSTAFSLKNPPSSFAGLLQSSLVTAWEDPVSGVDSYILSTRVADLQQSFYFVNPSMTLDGRYYWFYCAFPPGGSSNQGRSLGVADFHEGTLTHFPETQFLDASPLVDVHTGEVYWCNGFEIWKRSPHSDDTPVLINRLPREISRNRRPWRLATHLTFSADRKSLNLDAEFGGEWLVGNIPLDGSKIDVWQAFDRCYNHAQFSPTDPNLQLIAQDYSINPLTGSITGYDNRIWLIRRGQAARPLFPECMPIKQETLVLNPHFDDNVSRQAADSRSMHGHEWWSPSGEYVWYVHYGLGVERALLSNPCPEIIWPIQSVSHAHASGLEDYLVADCQPPQDPSESRVVFLNRKTGRQIDIVSFMPHPTAEQRKYHVHPHPQFCCNDKYICYTTTVLGRIDVAFTPVESLIEMTL